ncbi:MAG: hypothetical protein HYZ53_19190 [Planctomycetes bacterium]|nr:hypothetical protein [Planctomycetota bacterium]
MLYRAGGEAHVFSQELNSSVVVVTDPSFAPLATPPFGPSASTWVEGGVTMVGYGAGNAERPVLALCDGKLVLASSLEICRSFLAARRPLTSSSLPLPSAGCGSFRLDAFHTSGSCRGWLALAGCPTAYDWETPQTWELEGKWSAGEVELTTRRTDVAQPQEEVVSPGPSGGTARAVLERLWRDRTPGLALFRLAQPGRFGALSLPTLGLAEEAGSLLLRAAAPARVGNGAAETPDGQASNPPVPPPPPATPWRFGGVARFVFARGTSGPARFGSGMALELLGGLPPGGTPLADWLSGVVGLQLKSVQARSAPWDELVALRAPFLDHPDVFFARRDDLLVSSEDEEGLKWAAGVLEGAASGPDGAEAGAATPEWRGFWDGEAGGVDPATQAGQAELRSALGLDLDPLLQALHEGTVVQVRREARRDSTGRPELLTRYALKTR